MKRLLPLLLLLCACHHDHPVLSVPQAVLPTSHCSYVHYSHSGVVDPVGQAIAVLGDPTRSEHDVVNVYLCNGADCRVALPPNACTQNLAPCYLFGPHPTNPYVAVAPHQVTLSNAKENGYDTYAVEEYVCQ